MAQQEDGHTLTGLRAVYTEIAPTYERVNHAMTLGLDTLWRRAAARLATSVAHNGDTSARWLDACTGTGDMARLLARRAPAGTLVVGVDFTAAMLQQSVLANRRLPGPQPALALADVRTLPFPDATFDLLTISFATRNLWTNEEALVRALAEFCRVLKPGGRLIHLESSQPSSRLMRALFHAYVRLTVVPIGQAISGSRAGYAYLSSTMRRFYPAEQLADLLHRAGFATVRYRRLLFGAAAIHVATRE